MNRISAWFASGSFILCAFAGAILLQPPKAVADQLLFVNTSSTIYDYTLGGVRSTFATTGAGLGLAIDGNNDVFAGGGSNNYFYGSVAGAPNGSSPVLIPATSATNGHGQIRYNYELSVNSAGTVLYNTNNDTNVNGSIYTFTNSSTWSAATQSTFYTPTAPSPGQHPFGIVVAPNGDVFWGDYGGNSPGDNTGVIYEEGPGGGPPIATIATGLNEPYGLTLDAAGDLFESDWGSGHIYEFAFNGSTYSSSPITIASGLNEPLGLAFDASGNLYDANYGGGTIDEFTYNGATWTQSSFASGLSNPAEIAFTAPPAAVAPEPSGGILAALGVCGLGLLARRRRRLRGSPDQNPAV